MDIQATNLKITFISKTNNLREVEVVPKNSTTANHLEEFSLDFLWELITKDNFSTNFLCNLTVLDLSKSNLSNLPPNFEKLNLVSLNLSHNKLCVIPDCFYHGLKHLEFLDLSFNELSSFYIEPDCTHTLKYLKLNNNKFTNLPQWILLFRGSSLLEIDYSFNRASYYKHWQNNYSLNITKLRKLVLNNGCLLDEDFTFFKQIKSLEYLDISNEDKQLPNQFNDLDVLFIKPKWKNMQVLRLNNLSLPMLPGGILWIETLKELYFSENYVLWLPEGFEYLVNLEILDVSKNRLVYLPKQITALENLRIIKAAYNSMEEIPDFSMNKNLELLDVYSNNLPDITFSTAGIDLLDFENNYFETTEIGNNYSDKKNKLRNDIITEGPRLDGPKILSCVETSSSSEKSDISDFEYETEDVNVTEYLPSQFDDYDLENWDEPTRVVEKNENVSQSDDEWQGEERTYIKNNKSTTNRQYIDDEDWMFCDANFL